MARTTRTAPDDQKARNLTNQRNFRSRQKTYVAELEQRLRRYEEAEVAATARVQIAARLVSEENELLRDLICTQLRWSRENLNRYVSERARENVDHRYDQRLGRSHRPAQSIDLAGNGTQTPPFCDKAIEKPAIDFDLAPTSMSIPEDSQLSEPATSKAGPTAMSPTDSQIDDKMHSYSPTETADINENIHHPCNAISDSQLGRSMSCEEAATIISSLRRQDRLETVRQELGCRSPNSCKVTHNDLFQVMDDSI